MVSSPLVKKGFKSITLDCVKIIQVLKKEGPLRRSKIIEKTNIRKGNIDRRLYHLRAIGAIHLIKRKYQVTHAEERIEISCDTRVTHSLSLIPALRQIAKIGIIRYDAKEGEHVSEDDMSLFIGYAMDHLSYYSDVWKLIEERTGLEEKAGLMEEEFHLNLMEKLKNKFSGEPIDEPGKEIKHRSFIGTNIPAMIRSHLLHGHPTQVRLEGEKIWFGNMIAKGSHLENGIREFVIREIEEPLNVEAVGRIKNVRNSAIAIGTEIERETRKIILRIESGIPLRGRCEICTVTDHPS